MPELRWILSIVGVLFVAGLAWWESARRRRLPAPPPEEFTQQRFREPSMGLPEIRPREPAQDLPVIEIEDESLQGLRVEEMTVDVAPPVATVRPEPPLPPEPIVELPPEAERKVLSLRLVAPAGERFSGRILRQALAAEGFAHGKLDIFHKPGPDARAVVSAASLTQPGTLDLETMDSQRYSGLHLFSLLPGPLPLLELFDELIVTARALNDRLQGTLQDDHGELLNSARTVAWRESLTAEPPP